MAQPTIAAPAGEPCRKVLIVEEGPVLAAQLRRVLVKGGYQVEHLSDRCRGVMLGRRGRYAAIVVDAAVLDLGHGAILDALRNDAAPILILDRSGAEPDGETPASGELLALVNSAALAA